MSESKIPKLIDTQIVYGTIHVDMNVLSFGFGKLTLAL